MKNGEVSSRGGLDPSCRDDGGAGPSLIPGSGFPPCSVTALHELAHCVIARYFDLPIAAAAVISNEFFHGQVRGPEAPQNASPEQLIEAAEVLCAEAVMNLPKPGEDPSGAAPWAAHVQCRVTELLAGHAAEREAGYLGDDAGSTDLRLAGIYAATVCLPGSVPAYLDFCRAQAAAIFKTHWFAVFDLAAALDRHGTLDGPAIDQVIAMAVQGAALTAERQRRDAFKLAQERATLFMKEIAPNLAEETLPEHSIGPLNRIILRSASPGGNGAPDSALTRSAS